MLLWYIVAGAVVLILLITYLVLKKDKISDCKSEPFDPTSALLAADRSQKSYQSDPEGFDFSIQNKATDTQVFFDAGKNNLTIAFRGTSDIKDILTDVRRFRSEPGFLPHGCKVHRGFLQSYQSVRDKVLAFLTLYEFKTVLITGHSLGGALATLCALDVALHTEIKPTVYTFGSPRVGNEKFAKLFNMNIPDRHRVRHGSDAVPLLPAIMYQHVGVLTRINTEGEIIQMESDDSDITVLKVIEGLTSFHTLTDHKISNYVEGLDNLNNSLQEV